MDIQVHQLSRTLVSSFDSIVVVTWGKKKGNHDLHLVNKLFHRPPLQIVITPV